MAVIVPGIPISQLPLILTPTLSDYFPIDNSGSTGRETLNQVMSLFQVSITNLTGLTGAIEQPTFIGDFSGNRNLAFSYTPLAVNYISSTNAVTGSNPSLSATGSDANINLAFYGQGTGGLVFLSPTNTVVARFVPNSNTNSFAAGFNFPSLTSSVTYNFPNESGNIVVFTWNNITTTPIQMITDNGYIANNGTSVTFTLPLTSNVGDILEINGNNTNWIVLQNAGQNINVGTTSTTVGVVGNISSQTLFNSIRLLCVVANTTWNTQCSPEGGITII
jgi:hypothetical protein